MARANKGKKPRARHTNPTITAMNTSECALLHLPPELRNTIYRFSLVGIEDIIINDRNKPQSPSLLATCRQIRREAMEIYYQENEFHIMMVNYDSTTLQKWCKSPKQRAGCNLYYHIFQSHNWSNLMQWVQAAVLGKTGRWIPGSDAGARNALVATIFRMATRLAEEGKAWQEIVVYLEDVHEIMISQDRRWVGSGVLFNRTR